MRSKAYAAWMRRPRLQGCIHADFTQRPPLLTGARVFSHSTHICKLGGVADGSVRSPIKASPIAKETRIHADRPRHPWRERFALRAGLYGAIEILIAVVSANLNVRLKFSFKKTATNLHKGDKGGQWSKAYAAGMRRPRLQGCIHADFTQRPPLLTGARVFSHSTHICKLGGVADGSVRSPIKASPIAKETRIHADRPRHPWRERFALRAGLYGAIEILIAVVSANLNVRLKFSFKKTATNLHKGDKGGQWSKAYAAWMRRPRL